MLQLLEKEILVIEITIFQQSIVNNKNKQYFLRLNGL